jgi:hypothetical protein
MTKQGIYQRFCYDRGYNVKADTFGSYPKLKEHPARHDFDDIFWPPGQVRASPSLLLVLFCCLLESKFPKIGRSLTKRGRLWRVHNLPELLEIQIADND